MKYIYAPHRSAYFTAPKPEGCLFCRLPKADKAEDKKNLIAFRGAHVYVVLNKYPYNNGHTMVIPYKHMNFLRELPQAVLSEIYQCLGIIEETLITDYNAEGINVGVNIGRAAGAGVLGHIHYHILPRWLGEANFMTAIADTRVIPEDIHKTFRIISQGFTRGATRT